MNTFTIMVGALEDYVHIPSAVSLPTDYVFLLFLLLDTIQIVTSNSSCSIIFMCHLVKK